ncbi:MAG: Hsp20/alpha crystallin family protein, partial [Ignavibacteriae bacterium]|nr:Hsp20/alpha crystallin family protein [Ignavibacteriota bacterium]
MEQTKELTQVDEKRSWEDALEQESWVAPLVDLYETNDDYFIVAAMPGVGKEDVKVKVEDGNLIIMGRINYMEEM